MTDTACYIPSYHHFGFKNHIDVTMSELIYGIIDEISTKSSDYINFMDGSVYALYKGLDAYVYGKVYNTSFGDLVPQIIANAMNVNIIIVNGTRSRWYTMLCVPCIRNVTRIEIISNYEAYYSGNLPHISKLTSSSQVHYFGIKNPKNHCFINVILQIIYSVLRYTQHKLHIDNCVEGKIPEGIFDTAHKTPSAQEVETLRLQLSTYNSFFYWWNTTGCLWMPHVANWDHGHKVWAMPY